MNKIMVIIVVCLSAVTLRVHGADDYKKLSDGSKNVSAAHTLSAKIRAVEGYLSCSDGQTPLSISQLRKQSRKSNISKNGPSIQDMNGPSNIKKSAIIPLQVHQAASKTKRAICSCEHCKEESNGSQNKLCDACMIITCGGGCMSYPCYKLCVVLVPFCCASCSCPCCDGRCC